MMTFLTLFSKDIRQTARVYECIGLNFAEEQHGSGPVHLASDHDGQVLEIYPGLEEISRSALLGFEVENLEDVRNSLRDTGADIVQEIGIVAGRRRLIARDPDGRELFVQEVEAIG